MVNPRRSARVAAKDTSLEYTDTTAKGTKRKNDAAGSSPNAKREKTSGEKQQKTLDETMDL